MQSKKPFFESLAGTVVWRMVPTVTWVAVVGAVYTVGQAMADPSTLLTDRLFGPACGIRVEPVYYGEVFTNTRGGLTTKGATQYQGLFDLSVACDFEKMQSRLPGKLFVLAQNTHGRGLTRDFVGDVMVLSNIDSFRNITRVSEYWWELPLAENLTVRVGKQDLNTEFLLIGLAEDFIQSTYGLSPSTAFPTFPDPSMGVVALTQLPDAWRLKMGIWDAFSSGGNWGISGNDSVLMIGELEHTYALRDGTLPGVFVLGAVYESSGEVDGVPLSAVQEYILQLEQHIYRECPCDEDDMQGLACFVGYYPRFPGRLISSDSIGSNLVAGVVYRGLLPSRDEDVVGLGYSVAELFSGGSNRESDIELFYKIRVTPRASLQADLQYLGTPAGVLRDSIVVGTRFEIAL
jgi:porin